MRLARHLRGIARQGALFDLFGNLPHIVAKIGQNSTSRKSLKMHSTQHQGSDFEFFAGVDVPMGHGGPVLWGLADIGTQQSQGVEATKGPKMTQNDPKWPKSVEKALRASYCELEPQKMVS